jgi:chromosomal replication initiation ATPase DnaA
MMIFRLNELPAITNNAVPAGTGTALELYQPAEAGRELGKRATPVSHASGRNARGVSVTIHDIQRLVASRMGATALDLVSARQASARPRQVAMWLARHTTPASFPAIGRAFGNRDHTTVMQACRRVDALMAADPAFAAVVSELRGMAA